MTTWFPISGSSSSECIRTNDASVQYEDFACLYPTWGKTYLP